MTYPPTESLGYRKRSASIVDSYMSLMNRSTPNRSTGAVGSVSRNHPLRNRTWPSSKLYAAKFACTSSNGIASSLKVWCSRSGERGIEGPAGEDGLEGGQKRL